MALPTNLLKNFVPVIDWVETGDGVLSYRYPMKDREIPSGAQLTVRESQYAIFLDEGRLADIFGPGRYLLTTRTLPLLAELKNWDENFRSPFKSDIFFFSSREQLDRKWGTPTPIPIRDAELGPIRIRAHGAYSYRIENPKIFFEKVSGTTETYSAEQMDGQLRTIVVGALRGVFASSQIPFVDMAANQERLNDELFRATAAKFRDYGLDLRTLTVEGVSLPKELETHFDKAASMRMVGDVQKYLIFQAAESLTQPGGAKDGNAQNQIGVGLGIGLGIGNALKQLGGEGKTSSPDERAALPKGSAARDEEQDDTIATVSQLRELQKKGLLTEEELEQKVAALFRKKGPKGGKTP